MVEMIKSSVKLSPHREQALYEKFWTAVHLSVSKQVDEFSKIRTHLKEKLFKRNGIIRKEKNGVIKQVGIKPAALVQFIRNQNGYQNYSSRKITNYLKDIGALTLQEEKSNTVHIGKLKDGNRPLPRVLLIDVETLRDSAEEYNLYAEQARE